MKISTLESRLEKTVLRASVNNQKKYAWSVVKQFNNTNKKGEKATLSFDKQEFLLEIYIGYDRVFAQNFNL